MAPLIDPARDEIIRELKLLRRGQGVPDVHRLSGLFYLTEALGEGIVERVHEALNRIYHSIGVDPLTNVGAYFYMSGWGVGLLSIDERRLRYVEQHYAGDISTAWRRSDRGANELATIIRDRSETERPSAFISLFQSGTTVQPVLDFMMSYESWRPPNIFINDSEVDLDFHLHKDRTVESKLSRRIILPETRLRTDVDRDEPMIRLRVLWPMPTWPIWALQSWIADPRIASRMHTFRERASEASLHWSQSSVADDSFPLARDRGVWASRGA